AIANNRRGSSDANFAGFPSGRYAGNGRQGAVPRKRPGKAAKPSRSTGVHKAVRADGWRRQQFQRSGRGNFPRRSGGGRLQKARRCAVGNLQTRTECLRKRGSAQDGSITVSVVGYLGLVGTT